MADYTVDTSNDQLRAMLDGIEPAMRRLRWLLTELLERRAAPAEER